MQTYEHRRSRNLEIVLALCLTCSQPLPSFSAASAETVIDQKQYFCTGNQLQQFSANISLTEQDRGKPLLMTFYNGPNNMPRFNWVRVYLSDQSNRSAGRGGAAGQPTGRLIVTETSFRNGVNKVELPMTGLIRPGSISTIIITGAGVKGACVSWKITTPPAGAMQIISVTPTIARAGGSLMISGSGFSPLASDNFVYLDQTKVTVAQATATSLQATVPPTVVPGKYRLQVVSKGSKSNALPVTIAGLPELTRTDWLAGPSGTVVTIYGKNFSADAGENHVFFNKTAAAVKSATSDTLTVTVPMFPELDGSTYFITPTALDITLTVGTTPAKGHLTFTSARVGWQE